MIGKPEEIISDNAKEFAGREFKDFGGGNQIVHGLVSVESHQSNGRVERAIRIIREELAKNKEGHLGERLKGTFETYNESYHEGIKSHRKMHGTNRKMQLL